METQVFFTVKPWFREEIQNEQWAPYMPYCYGQHWAWVKYNLNGQEEFHAVDNVMVVFYPGEIKILSEKKVEFDDEPDS